MAHGRKRKNCKGKAPQALAQDPLHSNIAYCATFEQGLWKSEDFGESWKRIGTDKIGPHLMSVAVCRAHYHKGSSGVIVYAGTEPSALYCSKDNGESWEQKSALNSLPSSGSWSFPPRPQTHHIRWIAVDPSEPPELCVCIEAGALVRSFDGGESWKDRVRGGPYDTHTLGVHIQTPGRLCAAAGDGYFQSEDRGDTWSRKNAGLEQHGYLHGLAIDYKDPGVILVSAASSPFSAHNIDEAESYVYRKDGTGEWAQFTEGLGNPQGTIISTIAANPSKEGGGEFLLANNRGIYRSAERGARWERLDVPWSNSYKLQHAWSLCPIETG